jgi:hypothetical protein
LDHGALARNDQAQQPGDHALWQGDATTHVDGSDHGALAGLVDLAVVVLDGAPERRAYQHMPQRASGRDGARRSTFRPPAAGKAGGVV